MKIRFKDLMQDLIFSKYLYPVIFKKFTIPVYATHLDEFGERKIYCYSGVRYRWLQWLCCKLTGCKHRWWADARQDLGEGFCDRRAFEIGFREGEKYKWTKTNSKH